MSRQSGGFFSDMIRQLVALGAVAGLCWFGYDQGWVEEFVNKPPKSAEQSDNSGANASPAWDKSYGEPDKKIPSRPYANYTANAMKKLQGNIGEFKDEPGYSRDKFFIHDGNSWNKVSRQESIDAGWRDFPNKKCTVRKAVLIDQGKSVKYTDSCKITAGTFTDAYGERGKNGKITYKKSSKGKDFDIDHVVALSLAWRSGMSRADDTLRNMVANDKANLVVSDPSLNRSKGDQSIDTWFPPKGSVGHCDYVDRYAYTKAKYNMVVTQDEYDTLSTLVNTCSKK